jgi:hypothetical protein
MNLSLITDNLQPVVSVITPAFVVLMIWRVNALEKRVEKLTDLFIKHIGKDKL